MTVKTAAEVQNLDEVLSNFGFPSQLITVKEFGSGHINDSYLITYTTNDSAFLLQRINRNIFQDVDILMNNMAIVTAHLKKHVQAAYPKEANERTIELITTINGCYYYKDTSDNYWRVFNFLKHTKSYDIVTTVEQAFQGGRAFGEFLYFLSDMKPAVVKETIPDFHNLEVRLSRFLNAVATDPWGRRKEVLPEINCIKLSAGKVNYIQEQARLGNLPLRITHNDTKFNNVLLDQNDLAQCVVDLDTVMPGYAAYDFGDAIRTIVNPAAEDEQDVDKIKINIALYRAFTHGYLSETIDFLTSAELDSLTEGAILFPYMQAVRFLTDYLEGDHYYKIEFEDHNLQRARAQLHLFLKMEEQYDILRSIVLETASTLKKQPPINNPKL